MYYYILNLFCYYFSKNITIIIKTLSKLRCVSYVNYVSLLAVYLSQILRKFVLDSPSTCIKKIFLIAAIVGLHWTCWNHL